MCFLWPFAKRDNSQSGTLNPRRNLSLFVSTPCIDSTLRKRNSTICVSTENIKYITTQPCIEESSRWFYDINTRKLIDIYLIKCLTKYIVDVVLEECDPSKPSQEWIFENHNVQLRSNPLIPKKSLRNLIYQHNLDAIITQLENIIPREDSFAIGEIKSFNNKQNICITTKSPFTNLQPFIV